VGIEPASGSCPSSRIVVSARVGTRETLPPIKSRARRADTPGMVVVLRLSLALTACLAAMGVLMFSHPA
jgi:hypothetical protein